jgi:peroxiredoxin
MLERLLGHAKPAPDAGSNAPEISLPSMEGARFTLSDSRQRGPVVIAFFKVSCKTCQFTLPFLERLHLAYGNDPLEFWGISQDNVENSRQFAQEYGISFPIAIDADGFSASKSYVFTHVPTILLIDRGGKILLRFSGFSKAGLIRLSEEIAGLIRRPPEPAFLASELVPDAKPG